ncbi:hypothetical protein Spirs_3248 [Sediminispirochaeta smaragdinae DSM 11293]|uniref:Uncharacterized protein n=1 Tax=Sediminispirochaeta smaragdinae (strain DSM 11293 / JCM 15392 / SEBR 4228) TaxID=573413 RepID=E1R5L8_SEDSS|nr:hypothetical protein Spirs_3248 [Sediminispirochaeta smaragdinae DSM 11293]
MPIERKVVFRILVMAHPYSQNITTIRNTRYTLKVDTFIYVRVFILNSFSGVDT